MKQTLLLTLLLFTCYLGARGQVTLAQESFEAVSGDYGFTSNFGGTCNDLWDRVSTNPSCFADNLDASADGNAWVAGEDLDGILGAGVDGVVTLNTVNVSGFSSLIFRVAMSTSNSIPGDQRWDTGDNIYFEYNMDGGGWNTIGLYKGDETPANGSGDLRLDTDNNPVTNGPFGALAPNAGFQDVSFNIPVTGNNLQVRIRADIDGGSEEIGFDNLRVLGTASANNAPVLANIEGTAVAYNEGDPATQITNTITLSDTDDINLESATVSIISGFDGSEDVLAFTNQLGITGSYNSGTGVLTLTGTSSLANYQTALRSITYENTDAADASSTTRTIQFQVNDGTDGSNFQTRDIDITTAVNPPVALPICESFETNGEGTRYTSNTFDLGSGGANCDFFFRTNTQPACHNDPLSGVDGSFFWASEDVRAGTAGNVPGTVELSPLIATGLNDFTVEVLLGASNSDGTRFEADDALLVQYNFDGGSWVTIGAFYGTAGGDHMRQDADLNGAADPAGAILTTTLTNYVFTFNGAGTNINVRLVVDQLGGSEELVFDNICVSGAAAQIGPTLANIEGTALDYMEGDGPTEITNTITITDPDDVNLEGATVTICNGFVSGEDILFFGLQPGIGGLYNSATGVLTLSGTAPLSSYQTVLRSVEYFNNGSPNPDNGQREICFQVNDGDDNSNIVSRFVNVIEKLNDADCLPQSESFETDGEGTRYNSNAFDDNPDCNFFFRTNTQPTCHDDPVGGVDGSFFWASEDVRGGSNGNVPGIVELAPAIATDYTGLQVSVLLGVSANAGGIRFEPDDAILVQYMMDAGAWTTVGAFYGDGAIGGHMRQDADLNGTADPAGAILTSTLQDFTFSIPVTGNELKVRVVIDQLGGTEEIVFDNIRVDGTFSGTPIVITSQPTDQAVCENATANFNVTATGAGLTYQWQVNTGGGFVDLTDGGNVSGATTASLSLANVTPAMDGNQYRVVISSGCIPDETSNAATLTVNTESTPISLVTASINPICEGQSTDLTASGGIDGTGSSIVWYDGPNGTGNQLGTGTGITVSPSTTTTYYVRREGTCNTTADASITITVNPNPTPSISGALSYCTASGSTTLDAGAGFSSYLWSPGGEITQTIAATAGTYSVTVIDANGCSGTSPNVIVTENPDLTPVITGATEYCASEGGTLLDAGAGFASYSWSPGGQTTQTIMALAGTYSVTVTDANGCSGTSPDFIVTENPNPTPVISGANSYCAGTGGVLLDAGAGFVSYSWSPGGEITQTITALAGTYAVTVTDAKGCSGTSPDFTVTEDAGLSVTISGDSEYCEGTGGVILDAGAGFTTYSWSPGGEATQTITALAGTYSVTVTDASGCTGTSPDFVVTENPNPTPAISGASSYCAGTGGVLLDAGAGFVSYSWSPGGETTQTITALAGTYAVTVIDANGCSGTSPDFIVTEDGALTVEISGDSEYCAGTGGVVLDAGAGFSTYSWSPGGETTQTITALAGTYAVTVTDANGCIGTSPDFTVTENPSPDFTIVQEDLPDFCQGLVVLSADIINENDLLPPLTYSWSGGLGSDETATVTQNGTYDLTITDARGCSSTESITINVNEEDLTSSYTLLARNGIDFYRSKLNSGGAGVTRNNRKARFYNNSVVSTFVKAPVIQKFGGSTIANEIIGKANVPLPPFKTNSHPTHNNVWVGQGQTRTLAGSSYGKITVQKNATLIFTNPNVKIKDLWTARGVSVEFNQATQLIVDQFIDLGNRNHFNPGGEQVNVYIEKQLIVRWGSSVMANVYAWRSITAANAYNNFPTQMIGQFISRAKIWSGKFVEWNLNPNCDLDFDPGSGHHREPIATLADGADWNLYPNPTSGTTILELPELDKQVEVVIYDLNGREMMQREVQAGTRQVKLDLSGSFFMNAIYVVQVVGEGIFMTKKLRVNKPIIAFPSLYIAP